MGHHDLATRGAKGLARPSAPTRFAGGEGLPSFFPNDETMRVPSRLLIPAAVPLLLAAIVAPVPGQLPLAPVKKSGQSVTPAFEGWYRNADGSYSLSFGYYNRNGEEVLEIPVGPENFITPGDSNQGQPTHFEPRRHWGVFAVRVPADFGNRKVVWTLTTRGETFAIPGSLHADWQIDALEGEAGSGNTPPVLRFEAQAKGSPEARGPAGATVGPLTAKVGTPLSVSVWATDDGKAVGSIGSGGRGGVPVTLTWFEHQGPGDVSFAPSSPKVNAADGLAITNVTFSEPGTYILRVRGNDASGVANAGHAQCCWTNGFVKVTVTP
jgi:hypothetical protein